MKFDLFSAIFRLFTHFGRFRGGGRESYASAGIRLLVAGRKPYMAISHKKRKKPEKTPFSHNRSRFSELTRKPEFQPKTDYFTSF